jgi:hypothetical protein
MGRRCCCTTGGCLIGEDAFNRVSSTDIGSDLNELTGDWEIYGWKDTLNVQQGKLYCIDDGIALWTKKHISSKQYPSFVVSVDLPNVVVGCVYGIIANSNLTGTEYYWAKYTPANAGPGQIGGTLAIGKGASTLKTLTLTPISTYSPNVDKLVLCVGEHPHGSGSGVVSASLDAYDQAVWESDATAINYYGYCGLYGESADASTPAEFDNFLAYEGWWSDQECPKCRCRCYDSLTDHRVLPMVLKLIWNVEGSNQTLINCYDGVEVTLTWQDASEDWRGVLTPNPCASNCSGSGFTGATIPFLLECENDTLTGHVLQIDLEPEGTYYRMNATSASACLPLSLVFSFRNGASVSCEEDEDNATMWFEIVEP